MAFRPSVSIPVLRPVGSGRRIAALVAVLLLAATTLCAQSVPTGVQEYYVLGWEQHIWDMMDRVQNAQGGAQFVDGMNSVVTATASADNQVVYYDHWEDGLDAELANFPDVDPSQLQASTLVIGDGDGSNGDICDFNQNISCVASTDTISAGDYVNFNSDRGLGGGCPVLGSTPELCSVPLNPRVVTDIRYDGGDRIKTSGGPLTLIHSQYPLTNFIGGSIEILSRQAVEAARSYSVPIGENLYAGNTVTEPFHYVELDLVAFEDTSITVESPGAGSVSFDLVRGEHWSSMGFINDTAAPALELTINSGTKVSTTAPISGLIFTGGDGQWATRLYTLLPDILHSTDYVTTAPGDIPTTGPTTNGTPQNRPGNVYILNPDLFTDIDVDIIDSSGSYTVNIPANSMRSMDDLAPARNIAPNSTVRMISDRSFWGVTAYDWNTNISDWGHSWLAKKFLTSFYTVSFGPGNQNQPPDTSQYANAVFVAATADRTRIQFDLDNDGTYDLVDLDGDGAADAASFPDNTYEVDMLAALRVIDPNDNDMTGARILANKPVAVSWGQDTDRSYYSDQALDTGFTVYPVNQLFLDPALTIDKDVDTTVVPTASSDLDRTVTYTLTVKSYGFGPLGNVEVWDLLPEDVFGDSDYVTGSTLITCPDLSQGTVDPTFGDCTAGGPPADQDCGRLIWDIDGACEVPPDPFTLGTNNTLTVSYQVVIPTTPAPRLLTNEGHAQATLGGSVFSPFDTAKVVQTDVTLTKAVDVTTPSAGDLITFTLQVENTSTSVNETDVYISDPIPADTTFVPASITADGAFTGSGTFDAAQNAVVWNAALFPFSPSANSSATLSFQVRVNPSVPAGTEIPNRAGYESVETPYFLSNEVEPVVQGPALTSLKTIVGNPSVAHPSETVTFQIQINNTGTTDANNVFLSDPFPGNAAYVTGSMSWSLNSGPFVALTDANDGFEAGGGDGRAFADRLEFRLAELGSSQDLTLRFRVVIDPGTVGEFLSNQGTYDSDETPSTDTNLVQVPIVGGAEIDGHVFLDVDGDGTQDPGEPDIPNVDVVVTDPTGAVQRVTTDANGDYTATVEVLSTALGCYLDQISAAAYNGSNGTLNWAPTPWAEYGNGADGNTATDPMSVQNDPLVGASNSVLRIRGVIGNTASRGFTRQVDLDPGDSAVLSFRYHRRGLESTDIMALEIDYGSGFQLLDSFGQPPGGQQNDATWLTASYNLDGAQLPADPVTIRWRTSNEYGYNTDQFYFDDIEICATGVTDADVTINVDESDSDFPAGATLTTANDPQTVTAVPGTTVTAPDTGYQQPAIIFTKASDATDHEVSPGQTVTYTLEITNNSGATHTGILLDDPLPTGTTYVAGSSEISFETTPIEVRVASGDNDAEETVASGAISLGSTDLELVFDGATQQYVGMRFQNVAIPQGSSIATAEIEFETDETDTGTTNVLISGQDADDAAIFVDTAFNISSRPTTTATVPWAISPWNTVSEKHVSPDISSIVEEIVGRPGWSSGNDLVLMIGAGPGCNSSACQRTAESYNGEAGNAALLRVTLASTSAAGDPPDLLDGTEGYTLSPGATMTATFQVLVNDPLAGGITQITNTATLDTDQVAPLQASVTEDVVELGVVVEYDNAGFDLPGATVVYFHEVVNTGSTDDSYHITFTSELDWLVELVDPNTGAVIARDADGDDQWDNGVAINTGTLVPGEAEQYEIRVTIPVGTGEDVSESTSLIATSERNGSVSARATDETITVLSLDTSTHPVILLPDNSGVAEAGGTAVYSHRILNNTGAADTFDLKGWSERGWAFTFHWDANGDGVYTAGVDIAITNTLQLADGASQLFFVVVNVPGSGVNDGTVDVVHIGAESRKNVCDPVSGLCDPFIYASATDTTTVAPPTELDLSGGGTRTVDGGDTARFPGTLRNLTGDADTYDLAISRAWFFGFDAFDHPTDLWVDNSGNGVPDTKIAEDLEGDGSWDGTNGYSTSPSITVAAGTERAYELRRTVDTDQNYMRDPVTLTATSANTNDEDSITATVLLAAATAAVLADFDAYAVGGQVVVEWRTSAEAGTIGFDLWRLKPGEAEYRQVNATLVPGLRHIQGGTYRLVDRGAAVGESVVYFLHERDIWGSGTAFGPFEVEIAERRPTAKAMDALAAGLARDVNRSDIRGPALKSVTAGGTPSGMVKILVREDGLFRLSNQELATALESAPAEVSDWIASGNLWISTGSDAGPVSPLIFSDDFENGDFSAWGSEDEEPDEEDGVAWLAVDNNEGLVFWGEAIDSIYTRDQVYWLGVGPGLRMESRCRACGAGQDSRQLRGEDPRRRGALALDIGDDRSRG